MRLFLGDCDALVGAMSRVHRLNVNRRRHRVLLARRLLLLVVVVWLSASACLTHSLLLPRSFLPLRMASGVRYDALHDGVLDWDGNAEQPTTAYTASMKAEDYHTPQVLMRRRLCGERVKSYPQVFRPARSKKSGSKMLLVDEDLREDDVGAGIHIIEQEGIFHRQEGRSSDSIGNSDDDVRHENADSDRQKYSKQRQMLLKEEAHSVAEQTLKVKFFFILHRPSP